MPLQELDAREWQRQVAVVYQDYARLPLSAAENVAMFGRPHDPHALERATVDGADLAGLALEQWRDRVSAAFQDFQRFHLLLAESVGVGDLARIEQHEVVSHRFSTVRSADLILVLDQGRLLESGSHSQLMAAGGAYAELFELQAKAYV